MDWLWKVFLAGYVATGTCGSPFVDGQNKPDQQTSQDMPMENPKDPVPPTPPPPPTKTLSWQKVNVPGYQDGAFKKMIGYSGKPKYPNAPDEVIFLSKGKNNVVVQVANRNLSGFLLESNLKENLASYEIMDMDVVIKDSVLQNIKLAGNTSLGGGSAFFGWQFAGPYTLSTQCDFTGRYGYPSPSVTKNLVAVHGRTAVGDNGVFFDDNYKGFCHLFTRDNSSGMGNRAVWRYNSLNGVWVGTNKQFLIGKSNSGSGDLIATMPSPVEDPITKGYPQDITYFEDTMGDGLNAIFGISDTDVMVVGNNATVMHYDGVKWTDLLVPADLSGVKFTTVRSTPSGGYIMGAEGGKVLIYSNGEWRWKIHQLPTTSRVLSVYAWDDQDIYVLADDGLYRFYLH